MLETAHLNLGLVNTMSRKVVNGFYQTYISEALWDRDEGFGFWNHILLTNNSFLFIIMNF